MRSYSAAFFVTPGGLCRRFFLLQRDKKQNTGSKTAGAT